ncbi:DUF6339 family protein [Streptomyces sp. NPDC056600]|uniref:DNA cytosine methyltransferase n=1 Tax=Streptomyces sp. NPDC056600 TaxID=3345874 RepID=UPI0036C37923
MSFLYPRLLAAQARPLFEHYKDLSVLELSSQIRTFHEASVYVATGGDRVPESRLRELREAVMDLAKQAGFPDDSDRIRNADFDLRLAALLRSETGMVPAEAASRDVWAFLALVLLPDVAYWRYPQPPRDRVLGTDLTRHVFGRLWWRAHLVRDPDAPDPYAALAVLGEAAFDQIYARRTALGGSPHLVRAILRVWKDLDLSGLNERETLRDFLKRLLRLAPFVVFDGVGEQALDEELRAVADEAIAAQRPDGWESAAANASARGPEPTPHSPSESGDYLLPSPSAPAPVSSPAVPQARSAAMGSLPVQGIPDPPSETPQFSSVEFCAGCGAQAYGLEQAGFQPRLLIDSKADACFSIDANRPQWDILCMDINEFSLADRPEILGVDLVSAGLPRVKSAATVGTAEDSEERKVLRTVVRLTCEIRPKAVLLENLPDLVESDAFAADRAWLEEELAKVGLRSAWQVLNAAQFGVPQNRSSGFLVALQEPYSSRFSWPQPTNFAPPTVGEVLGASMAAGSWPGADAWAREASRTGPALVGGSDRRGGADLGPTGSKNAWAALGVNGNSLGDAPPEPDFPVDGQPKLTVEQAALIQAIPSDWQLSGGKTSRYRQIGHAMPPPLATAVGSAIAYALLNPERP